ncbi:hypothetical protein [Streptomyces sp. NPDC048489]|uniref:hypothetical protein n=1 Tax=Streptomyces sp. NPDC048489 TaxID=3154504 RepID=UPI00344575A1
MTDTGRPAAWWRNRDLLSTFGLPALTAWSIVAALVGSGGVLHAVGGAGPGWFFLASSLCGLVALMFEARLARGQLSGT